MHFDPANPYGIPEYSFHRLVDKQEDGLACWEWRGELNGLYGVFRNPTVESYAHRVAYVVRNGGEIPGQCDIHHMCENTFCVNPDHLVAVDRRAHKLFHKSFRRPLKRDEQAYLDNWRDAHPEEKKMVHKWASRLGHRALRFTPPLGYSANS